jgi:hypothetical protein
MVVIGVEPHKQSHAVVADELGRESAQDSADAAGGAPGADRLGPADAPGERNWAG